MIVVLMGVSGSGKTTVGRLLAKRLHCAFQDVGDLHSPANRKRMAAGVALTDDDRQPWLAALHTLIAEWFESDRHGVLACSALRASHRMVLRANLPADRVRFVLLQGSNELIAERLRFRTNHFMPLSLLASQLGTLEPDETALVVSIERPPERISKEILERFRLRPPTQAGGVL